MIDVFNRITGVIALALVILALGAATPAAAEGAEGVVNVNTASASELALLPRVGPAVAERIVAFRDENDGFEAPEELLLVRGIGERTYDLLEPYVAVSGETTLSEKVRLPREADGENR